MSEDNFRVEKGAENQPVNEAQNNGGKIIDEAAYRIHAPREKGPTAVGRGGDPLFRRISATKEQLLELMELKLFKTGCREKLLIMLHWLVLIMKT